LLLGWRLLQLAYHQQFAAALLPPLNICSTPRRPYWGAVEGRAVLGGASLAFLLARDRQWLTAWRVVGEVFALNVGFAILAVGP
jgi:hypothetical protein